MSACAPTAHVHTCRGVSVYMPGSRWVPSPSCLLAFPGWPWSSFLLHPLLAWSSDTSCPLLKKEPAGGWQWSSENWPAQEGAPPGCAWVLSMGWPPSPPDWTRSWGAGSAGVSLQWHCAGTVSPPSTTFQALPVALGPGEGLGPHQSLPEEETAYCAHGSFQKTAWL